ncbi:MAG: 2-C-methyl-D-erythritol 4-phosphate cytidylyltransferase [Actinomycetia bacterium]|nr:2-C-methyl-D-erythritol 4-phosphate cytidylyltransferase [Actinomycetes bacterium]
MRIIGIIAAGGSGSRMGLPEGKQLLEIAGKPVVAWSTQALCDINEMDEVIVVCDPDRVEEYSSAILTAVSSDTPLSFVGGGETRAESVLAGMCAISEVDETEKNPDMEFRDTVIVIHDGARPLATATMMQDALNAYKSDEAADGVVVGHPSSDTLKRVEGTRVIETPDRSQYWAVQTPQIFTLGTLLDAYKYAMDHSLEVTDDSSLVEAYGKRVVMHLGPRDNIKVTCPEDVAFVEAALLARA